MYRAFLASVVVVVTTGVVLVAGERRKPEDKDEEAKEIREKFYRCWVEIERVRGGISTKDPDDLSACDFNEKQLGRWPRRGELSQRIQKPGPRIDPKANPMRVDFRGEGRSKNFGGDEGDEIVPIVSPCIFKFDGENLVIAYGETWVVEKELKKGEDYPGRPADFTSTKMNKRTIETMKPCGMWETD